MRPTKQTKASATGPSRVSNGAVRARNLAAGSAASRPGRSPVDAPPGSPPRWPAVVLCVAAVALVAWVAKRLVDRDEAAEPPTAAVATAVDADPRTPDGAEQLALSGRGLGEAEAAALEARVARGAGDLSARTRLVGYYGGAGLHVGARAALGAHVLWLATHVPEAPILGSGWARLTPADGAFADIVRAFETHTSRPDVSPTVLRHAARFVESAAPERALALLERGAAAEPGDPEWAYAIGRAETAARAAVVEAAAAASGPGSASDLAATRSALVDAASGTPFAELPVEAGRALDAGDLARAAAFAEHALDVAPRHEDQHTHGWVVHHANVVLGHVALRVDRVPLAEAYLLRAAAARRSARLTSAGPDTTLAAALLDRGRRDAVLLYLDRAGHLWPAGREGGQIARWRAAVKEGRPPDFPKVQRQER